MGLFDSPFSRVRDFIREKEGSGELVRLEMDGRRSWPRGQELILEDETALELGHPEKGSLFFLAWTENASGEDEVMLVGPDLQKIPDRSAPFALAVLVSGQFEDEYDCFRDLRDEVFDTRLRGMASRVMPSRQTIWTRVKRDALENGMSLAHLGAAIIDNLRDFEFVSRVQTLFVTSAKEDVEKLAPAALESDRIARAMIKMTEEMSYDCESCEFSDVCEDVAELKRIRARLGKEGPA